MNVTEAVAHECRLYHEEVEFELRRAVFWYANKHKLGIVDPGWLAANGRMVTIKGKPRSQFWLCGMKMVEIPTAESWVNGERCTLRYYGDAQCS